MRTTELVARLRLDASQFDKSVKQSQAELQAFSRVAGALPGGRSSIFGALAADAANLAPVLTSVPLGIAAVGAALAGAGIAARRAGVEFEASLAKISTLGPEAKASLEATREAILDTYASVPVTGGVNDLAEANYLLQSSGRSAAEAVVDLRVAAEASVAGYASVTTVVDGLTTVTNAWKESQISTQQASDVLFSAVNVGKATFDQIASSIGLVAPIAAAAGVRFQEVAAAVGVLSKQGVPTTSIMEGLRSAIVNIQTPTEKFKKQFADLSTEFTASRLARDGIIKFLIDFDTRTNGSQIALRALLPDVTGFSAALGLLKNGGNDAAAALKKMEDAAGATQDALADVATTAKAQEQLIRNQISGAWTQFGEMLNNVTLPILAAVGRALNDMTDGASFAAKDVGDLLTRDTSVLQTKKIVPYQRVLDQFNDNPTAFVAQFSAAKLREIANELEALRRIPAFQNAGRVDDRVLGTLRGQADAKDALAARDRLTQENAGKAASAKADELATDEELQRKREAGRVAAEKAAEESARQREAIVKDAAQLTEQLRAKAVEALQGTAGALQDALQQTLAKGAAYLNSGALSPDAAATLTAELRQLKLLQSEMIEVARQAELTQAAVSAMQSATDGPAGFGPAGLVDDAARTAARDALDIRVAELRILADAAKNVAARKQYEEQISAIIAARNGKQAPSTPAEINDKLLRDRISAYGDLAQSIATVGDQLGLLPRRATDALRGIGALAEQGSQLAKAFSSGSGIGLLGKIGIGVGIAGGVASLAAGLFGDSPEDKQRREDIRTNTAALRKLTDRVGDLASSSLTGTQLTGARAASDRLSRSRGLDGVAELSRFLKNEDVMAFAKEWGIALTSATGIAQFRKALETADLNAYLNTFAGSLERLDDTLAVYGVTDPIERFTRRVAALIDPKTGFPALAEALAGLDLSTVDGRDEAGRRAQGLFERVASGELTASQLGGLSVSDARKVIVDFITSARETTASTGTGGFNETRTITEVTGSRLAGLFSSANQYLSTIAADVARLRDAIVVGAPLPLLAPPSGLFGAYAGGGAALVISGGISITVQLALTADVLRSGAAGLSDAATRFGQGIGDAVMTSIDQQLRERALRQKLLTGDARLSR